MTKDFWPIAEQVCTPKELQALKLNIAGMGSRRIARALGISPQEVKERLFRGEAEDRPRARKESSMSVWLNLTVAVCVLGSDDKHEAAEDLSKRFHECLEDEWLIDGLTIKAEVVQ